MDCNWEEPSLPDLIFLPTDTYRGVGHNKNMSLHPLQKGTASAVHQQEEKQPSDSTTRGHLTIYSPPIQQAGE